MTPRPLKLLAVLALLACAARPARLRAQYDIPQYDSGEEAGSTTAQRFLRAHWELLTAALPIAMGALYVLIMGPRDLAEASKYVHFGRAGQVYSNYDFGTRGQFWDDSDEDFDTFRKNP